MTIENSALHKCLFQCRLNIFVEWKLVDPKQGSTRKAKASVITVTLDEEDVHNNLKFAATGLL